MYYGVEQSTDMRDKRTVIKKFASNKVALLKWMKNSGGFTYDDPESARNYHHTFRKGYELNGRVNKKDKIFMESGTPTYPRNDADNLAAYLYKYGSEIKE